MIPNSLPGSLSFSAKDNDGSYKAKINTQSKPTLTVDLTETEGGSKKIKNKKFHVNKNLL